MSNPTKSYAESYRSPNGPGDARPTALQIVEDNQLVGVWKGRVVLVTGGTSGIGVETVRALHATGADVWFTARDASKGQNTLEDISKSSRGEGLLQVLAMDLDSLESVREAADSFLKKSSKLNILINNAGIMATPYSKTKEGFERQFAVNHLAHYLLTTLLLPTLKSSSTAGQNSRVINLSSTGHRLSTFQFDNYNFEKPGSYEPFTAYGQSKTANAWTANYIDRVFGPLGVRAFSVHPGAISSGIQAFCDPALMKQLLEDPEGSKAWQTAQQGAATSVWAAVAVELEGQGGKYLSQCSVAGPAKTLSPAEFDPGYAPHLYDQDGEERLWNLSASLVHIENGN
ncbi:unnamed protein product [Clonostachys solani]|uniref:Short-chain dehydrogenase n=1 Tax=Clonostachys solani TaxID=160281 RepID=A0A9N9W7Z1_9HYPO|nr:unnamed protein product [Clonostachys solani]